MAMSLNSAESKISPQDWHSTNSASSSRETILTMGCLQGAVIGEENPNGKDFARLGTACQLRFASFFVEKRW
jgi:hypothetical protein